MLITKSEYLTSAVAKNQYPHQEMPQFLLLGRSNVGKSSFINTITGRKNLAYVSSKPGKTTTLNFYLLNESFMFVDAPGYGYAKRTKEVRVDYGKMLETYFNVSVNCKSIMLIIDSLVGPTEDDLLMFDYLKHFNLPFLVIATKLDKVNKSIQKQTIMKLQNAFGDVKVIGFSSLNKAGLDEIEVFIKQSI